MKITEIQTMILKKEVSSPVSDSRHTYDVGGHLVTKVVTDAGIAGYGLTYFGRIKAGMSIVKTIVEQVLTPVLLGQDPCFVRKLRDDMFVATEYFGTVGVANFAISAVDCALWDILGKKAGLPVGKLLGARREAIPAYAMVGWYYDGGEAEFVSQCLEVVRQGFGAVKLKVGRDSLRDDITRIRRIRKELGEDFRIMVDANCIFDEAEALRRGSAYEDEGIYWFEEPVQPYLRDAHVRLAKKLKISIAIGENYYTRHQFHDVIHAGCAAIVQPDNRRAGGVTEWIDIAAISEAAGLKLASHGGGPANVNILCALENAIYIECGDQAEERRMYKATPRLVNGALELPDAPGMGTELREDYVERYRIDA